MISGNFVNCSETNVAYLYHINVIGVGKSYTKGLKHIPRKYGCSVNQRLLFIVLLLFKRSTRHYRTQWYLHG